MLKHAVSELKEALLCLRAGQVTLGYPFEPHPPQPGFRGLPRLDMEKCIGCGACANACPSRSIVLIEEENYRTIDFNLARCTYCAQCRDACPEQAVTLSDLFETATACLDDLRITIQLVVVRCRDCGEVVGTRREVDKVLAEVSAPMGLKPEEVEWKDLCINCKRGHALQEAALTVEVSR
jgi:hydrogenase-4 component H